jgi:molecular chaperone GrpE
LNNADEAKNGRFTGDEESRAGSEAANAEQGCDSSGGARLDDVRQQIARLEAEKQELHTTLVRRQADFENFRKRVERERQSERERALAGLIEGLLPVVDAFERALDSGGHQALAEYRKGVDLIHRQLMAVLSKHGLRGMKVKGEKFDPHLHHAVERVHTDEYEDGTVIDEVQPGYYLNDRVLQPAMVRVAVNDEQNNPGGKD